MYLVFHCCHIVCQWQRGLPIEVIAFAYKVVKLKIEKSLGGVAELRMAKQKAVSQSED